MDTTWLLKLSFPIKSCSQIGRHRKILNLFLTGASRSNSARDDQHEKVRDIAGGCLKSDWCRWRFCNPLIGNLVLVWNLPRLPAQEADAAAGSSRTCDGDEPRQRGSLSLMLINLVALFEPGCGLNTRYKWIWMPYTYDASTRLQLCIP